MNPHAYQYERIGAAIRALMLPDTPFEAKLATAMVEFWLAFHTSTPSDPALHHYMTVREIMGEGKDAWEDRAKLLTATQRTRIVSAFWELDRAVSREYFTYAVR